MNGSLLCWLQERAADLKALADELRASGAGDAHDVPPLKKHKSEDDGAEFGAPAGVKLAGGVPRHLRRRTRSHARRRMPVKARMKPLQKAVDKKQTREHRREASALRARWSKERMACGEGDAPPTSPLHLETHLWSVKRVHMQALWGYNIGVSMKDKGYSAIAAVPLENVCLSQPLPTRVLLAWCPLQAVRSRCILHDCSYLVPYRLSGTLEDICGVLASFEVRNRLPPPTFGKPIHGELFFA